MYGLDCINKQLASPTDASLLFCTNYAPLYILQLYNVSTIVSSLPGGMVNCWKSSFLTVDARLSHGFLAYIVTLDGNILPLIM